MLTITWDFSESQSFCLGEGLTTVLMAVTDQSGWGDCGSFLNKTTVKFAASIDSSFHEQLLYSMHGCLIAFYSQ